MAQQAQGIERVDPRPRSVSRGQAGTLKFGRVDRAYLLANPNDDIHGLQFHLDSGWRKINGGKDGDKERVHSGRVDANGEVSYQGQVLIWIEKEEYDARQADMRATIKAREAKKQAPGGIDNIVDAQGKLAQNIVE
jgi:hypothetical protein